MATAENPNPYAPAANASVPYQKGGIYLLMGIVGVAAIAGAAFEPAGAVQTFAFASMIEVGLLNLLKSTAVAAQQQQSTLDVKNALVTNNAKIALKVAAVGTKLDEAGVDTAQKFLQLTKVAAETHEVGQRNHELLNSAKGLLLDRLAEALHQLAIATGTPEAMAAADEASRDLADHQERQAASDRVSPEVPHTTDPPQ
jgi:hypothetical protein